MPNWAHNTLTVTGDEAELAAFVEQVRTDEQPLSFEKIVPQPSDEELRKLETYKTCTMCGGHGDLPETPEQASERGARWYDWMAPEVRLNEHGVKDRHCNVCQGSGEELVGMSGWYEWRCEHWGTKWDASFSDSGPAIALGAEGMDPELSKSAQGGTITPTVAIYKFDTAWSPPEPAIEAASEQHPELEFTLRWAELGSDAAAEVRFVSGCCVADEELEVEDVLAPEEMWF